MAKLTASMVVDLKDNTGPGSRSAMRNLRNMKREGDMLTRSMDRQALEQVRRRDQFMNAALIAGRMATTAALTAGVVAGKAFVDFAEVERRVNRIAINAGKGADQVQPIIQNLQTVAKSTKMGFNETVEGLEALIASGRTLDEGLAFLPAVATTAQASGAAITDIALSADALSNSLKIGGKDMQAAFDILVAGGKQGKFELKDMAQYLPSLLPLFNQIGYEGTKDLKKIVGMLQLVRNKAGTASEANTYLRNVVGKMFSNETNTKFKKFGVNLQKELKKAKDEGKDVLETFLDISEAVMKKNKLEPAELFSDSEFQLGMMALLSQREGLKKLVAELNNAGGQTMKDFIQATSDAKGSIDEMKASWDELWNNIGKNVAKDAVPLLNNVNKLMDDMEARSRGVQKTTYGDSAFENEQEKTFAKRYREQFPDMDLDDWRKPYEMMLRQVGRDQAKSVFEYFRRLKLADEYGKQKRNKPEYAARGPQMPMLGDRASNRLYLDDKGNLPAIADDKVPVPGTKPKPMTAAEIRAERRMEADKRRAAAYRDGTGRDAIAESSSTVAKRQPEVDEIMRQRAAMADRNYDWFRQYENGFSEFEGGWHRAGKGPKPTTAAKAGAWRDAATIDPLETDLSGVQSALDYVATTIRQAADAAFRDAALRNSLGLATEVGDRRNSFERETGPRFGVDSQPNAIDSFTTGSVRIEGTPTVITQPSGVQQVTMTNPPQPTVINVSAQVTVNEAANGAEVARQFASNLKTAIAGTHADMTYQAHA